MKNELSDVIKKFHTPPFLFAGAGLSRRYCNIPDWETLLKLFTAQLSGDEFYYNRYYTLADLASRLEGSTLPKVASLIEADYNERWFADPNIRSKSNKYINHIKKNVTPFKVEVANLIDGYQATAAHLEPELKLFSKALEKSISGIITTNYDTLLERVSDYTAYIGQEELMLSAVQGIAEIYKIHGCVTRPGSIVINEEDYLNFIEKSEYLAAKLMTIFVEYPIVFIGYSLNDINVQRILKSIVTCMPSGKLEELKNRFIFIEYDEGKVDPEVSPYFINFDGKILVLTKIAMNDYSVLYSELLQIKSVLPVKLLRFFRQEFYRYTLSNNPTNTIVVADIDDGNIGDRDLVLAIGTRGEIGLRGVKGITLNEWYSDIILDNLHLDPDDLLEHAFPSLFVQSNRLPLNKYLSKANNRHERCISKAEKNYDDIISKSIKRARSSLALKDRSVDFIVNNKEYDLRKKIHYMAHLKENEMNKDRLSDFLKSILSEYPNFFFEQDANACTNLRRLIRIYDYLEYGEKAKESWA